MRISPLFLAGFVLTSAITTSAPAAARLMEPTSRLPSVTAHADEEVAATRKKPPPRKKKPRKPTRPAPDPRTRAPAAKRPNPAMVGLAAAGGAGGGAFIGASAVGISTLILFGAFGAPTLPVIITAAVVAIGLGLAAPFIAALGGGGAVLLMDPRTKPEEWSSLIQCAASGYCAGVSLVGGTLLGGLCGTAPCGGSRPPGIPGPDQAAEWTAGAAIAGLFGGTVMGGLIGWSVAPVPDDPLVPITVGALGGAVLGSAVSAGVGAALASAIKR